MGIFEPQCYSGSPIMSKLGKCTSKDIYSDIKSMLNHRIDSSVTMEMTLDYKDVANWTLAINYNEFWIDGGHIGVMIHPCTHTPVWLNAPAIEFCHLIDNNKTLDNIFKKLFNLNLINCENGWIEKYIEFVLLLEDLDMITVRRNIYE